MSDTKGNPNPHLIKIAPESRETRARSIARSEMKAELYSDKPPAIPMWHDDPEKWKGILPDTYSELVEVSRIGHPEWDEARLERHARIFYSRYPELKAAISAVMEEHAGRSIREKMEHGIGVFWPELMPLHPAERTFVLAVCKKILNVRKVRQ